MIYLYIYLGYLSTCHVPHFTVYSACDVPGQVFGTGFI